MPIAVSLNFETATETLDEARRGLFKSLKMLHDLQS